MIGLQRPPPGSALDGGDGVERGPSQWPEGLEPGEEGVSVEGGGRESARSLWHGQRGLKEPERGINKHKFS